MNLRYLAIGLLRRTLPKPLLFAIMRQRGDGNGSETNPAANLALWQTSLGQTELAGKHVLEIGSGRYARLALHMLAAGARRVTLIDLYAMPLDQPQHRALLARDCATLGLDMADALARIELVQADFLELPVPPPEQRADLALSSAVLEHVYDPGQILARCYAWLKPGGLAAHMVDLRDHNMQFRMPFEMLTYSDWIWRCLLDIPGGFHLNRWRAPDYMHAALAAGFEQVRYEVSQRDLAGARIVAPRLHAQFRSQPEEILAVLGITLFASRPAA